MGSDAWGLTVQDGPTPIAIEEADVALVATIGEISCAFRVEHIYDLMQRSGGAPLLVERPAPRAFTKDYDAIPGNRPAQWAEQFDLANWGLLIVRKTGSAVGAALVAFDTPGVDMLEGRSNLAVLWDLRVGPDWRGRGIGQCLIAASETSARNRDCREIRVETQTINVGACRAYQSAGFHLLQANPNAYPDLPDETQLIWSKALERGEA